MALHTPDWNPGIWGGAMAAGGATGNIGLGPERYLDQYLDIFRPCFRPGQTKYAVAYIKGLMSDLEYKSAEPIALRYGVSVRGIQRFLKDGKWHDERMRDIYCGHLAEAVSCGGGMVTVDRRDNPKKGKGSVGVARQYCGSVGKAANCQSGVYVGYAGEKGHGLLDCGLYLPETWFGEGHKKLREKCGVPESTMFRTKASMAAEMVQKVLASRLFPVRWVGMDGFFGDSKEFLTTLPKGMWYFADTSPDTPVFHKTSPMAAPDYSGRGHEDLNAALPATLVTVKDIATGGGTEWTRAYLGGRAIAPITIQEKCVRVIQSEKNTLGEEVWLYIRKLEDGEHKFSFCNAPSGTPVSVIRSAASMRWSIGQCFDECQSYLGLNQYEGRSWNTWHRHNLLVFVARLFWTCLRHNRTIM